jgi:RNA polymerase sigma-70 factor, ECF subfamily
MDKISRSGRALSSTQRWTDEQILIRYRETDDPELFRVLTDRYEQEIYSYLRRFLGNAEMAEDAFQATFLQLHLKRDQFEAGRKVRPWLYMIATNQAIDLQRRSKRHRMLSLNGVAGVDTEDAGKLIDVLLSQERSPLQTADDEESRRWLRDALDQLPEHLRIAVNLVYFQGLKYREAAEVLSIPVGTVKSRLHAAILKLSEAWNSAHLDHE